MTTPEDTTIREVPVITDPKDTTIREAPVITDPKDATIREASVITDPKDATIRAVPARATIRAVPATGTIESVQDDSLSYFNILWFLPMLTVKASWQAFCAGMPFGGTLGAMLMTIMSNDSGEFPFVPLIAGLISLPIAVFCDTLLYIPCIAISMLKSSSKLDKVE